MHRLNVLYWKCSVYFTVLYITMYTGLHSTVLHYVLYCTVYMIESLDWWNGAKTLAVGVTEKKSFYTDKVSELLYLVWTTLYFTLLSFVIIFNQSFSGIKKGGESLHSSDIDTGARNIFRSHHELPCTELHCIGLTS